MASLSPIPPQKSGICAPHNMPYSSRMRPHYATGTHNMPPNVWPDKNLPKRRCLWPKMYSRTRYPTSVRHTVHDHVLKILKYSTGRNPTNAHLLQVAIEDQQIELGGSGNPLHTPIQRSSYMTPTWLLFTTQFMDTVGWQIPIPYTKHKPI